MEAAEPICETPEYDEKINFIEELLINDAQNEYKIEFGQKENKKELTIRVTNEKMKNIFYFQHSYTMTEFKHISKIFSVYETVEDLISFLKNQNEKSKFIIEEQNNNLIIKFDAFLPDGKNILINLKLEKEIKERMQIIKYFFDEIKSFKDNININIKKEISLLKETNEKQQQKIKEYENQIKNLNNSIDKNQKEISDLMKFNKFMPIIAFIFLLIFTILACFIMNYKFENEISNMKEENKKILDNYVMNDSFNIGISNMKGEYKELLEKINKLNEKYDNIKQLNVKQKEEIYYLNNETIKQIKDLSNKLNGAFFFESNIVFLNSIEFILDYIKKNNNEFIFNRINLLYRATRDGDTAKAFDDLCDLKSNILIIVKTYKGYIFGGYSKIGIKISEDFEDNNSFLFSINYRKIYPVIKYKKINFYTEYRSMKYLFNSFVIYDNFLNYNKNYFRKEANSIFDGLKNEFEINGGEEYFKCKELEVFQLS